MRNFLKLLFGVVIVIAIAQCSMVFASDWPTQYSNNQNNPLVFDTFKESNSSSTVDMGSMVAGPSYVIGDGIIYTTSDSHGKTISAYDLNTSQLAWQKTFPIQTSNLIFDSGKIYFASDEFYALNGSDGNTVWKSNICSLKTCKALRIENGIIFGARSTSYPYANAITLDKVTGALTSENLTNSITINTDVVIDNSQVYYMSQLPSGAYTSVFSFKKLDLSLTKQFTNCPANAYGGILDKENAKMYLSANSRLCSYDLNNLTTSIYYNTGTYGGFVEYGNIIYAKGNYSLMSFGAEETNPFPKLAQNMGLVPYSNSLVVNGVLYFGTNTGKIWGVNLETAQTKVWDIEAGSAITNLAYAGGKFILTSRIGNVTKLFIIDLNNLSLRPNDFTLEISSPYNTAGMNQYLGQLHCHYIPDFSLWNKIWNGEPSPSFTVSAYKNKEYDFIALTEHNQIVPMPDSDENFMLIQNAEESTQEWGHHHLLAIGVNSPIDDSADDQSRIDSINMQGGIPIFAHPDSWLYGALGTMINKFTGLKHIEAYNRSVQAYSLDIQGNAFDDFDYLLSKRNDKFLTAGDDYTPGNGFIDGGAVVVFAKHNTQPEIMESLKNGNFYAVEGSRAPRINSISVQNSAINITVGEASNITFIGKDGKKLKTDKNVSSAIYSIQGNEIFVRAEIESVTTGKNAWAQPILVTKQIEHLAATSGIHAIDLDQMILKSSSTDQVAAKVLSPDQYPASIPPAGYLSPAYEFSTPGQVQEGTELSINYNDVSLPVGTNNLSIFSYDTTTSSWQTIPSAVDTINKVVTANLTHFSLYTLSANIPSDAEKPTASLLSPTDLSNLSGKIDFQATATDNEAVTSVRFSIGNKQIGTDIDESNGWTASIDTSGFINGNHKLTVSAEDFAGNVSEIIYDLTTSGGIVQPTIAVSTPGQNSYLYDPSNVTGSFTSAIEIEKIGIYLDDVFIDNADADLTDSAFNKSINWSEFKEGQHKLKLDLRDQAGNSTSTELDISIGQNVTASIVSPENKSYLQNQIISLRVDPTPSNASISISLDGKTIGDNTNLDLTRYSLGKHIILVKFNDKLIASSEFTTITNYSDTKNTVMRLYREGHIKNPGIANSIMAQLNIVERFSNSKCPFLRKLPLGSLMSFIIQQSIGPKAKINGYARAILFSNVNYLMHN